MIFTLPLALDNSGAYASGDVLSDTKDAGVISKIGADSYLDSIFVIDVDAQGQAFDVVFLSANKSLGTFNLPPTIADADVLSSVIGVVSIAITDYKTLQNSQIAMKTILGIPLCIAGNSHLYVGTISRGTGTYSSSGLTLKLDINPR